MKKVLSLITALILLASPVFATKQAGSVAGNATNATNATATQEVKKPVKKVKKVKKEVKKEEGTTAAPEKR
jgi:hypothetical protein